jgi:hypothetical protein
MIIKRNNEFSLFSLVTKIGYAFRYLTVESFEPHYGPGVDSAFNRNEYQEYFLGVKAAGA